MELPKCAQFQHGECPRSDMKILKDADDFWLVGCMTCGSSRVLSKPTALARGRYEAEQQRIPIATKREIRMFMSHSQRRVLQK
jgi:hypothetical protein